ncbi:hypothetical protein [Streptomyces sp. NPDC002215]|uniref:hypothetical protein n=1 Tax=Streptomyces sp. NPDC002215 TaxID=3154412 RepID=UPI003329B8C7
MTVLDALINGGIAFGPGLLLAAGAVTVWRTCRWVSDRTRQLIDDRAARRRYTAIANRLHAVANSTDAYIAAAGDQLADRLLQQIYANDTRQEG